MNLFNLRRTVPSLEDLAAEPYANASAPAFSNECLMPSVQRPQPVFVRGQGSWLWDSEDRTYLDFTQAGAANSLGHSPSVLVAALAEQAQSLINPGSGFYNRGMLKLCLLYTSPSPRD